MKGFLTALALGVGECTAAAPWILRMQSQQRDIYQFVGLIENLHFPYGWNIFCLFRFCHSALAYPK